MAPKFAVAESADLARALTLSGFNLLTERTDVGEVAEAIRGTTLSQRELIIITPAHTPTLIAWIQSLTVAGRLVIVLGDNPVLPKTAHVSLPCTVNDILAICKAPQTGTCGDWIVSPDYSVSAPASAESDTESPFDSLSAEWDASQIPSGSARRYWSQDVSGSDSDAPPRRLGAAGEEPAPPARIVAPVIPQPVVPRPAAPPAAVTGSRPPNPQPVVPQIPAPPTADAAYRPPAQQQTFAYPPASDRSPSVPGHDDTDLFRPEMESHYEPAEAAEPPRSAYLPAEPVWRPTSEVTPQPAPQPSPDFPLIIGERYEDASPAPTIQPTVDGPCPVILVAAAKGGVGKTAFTLMLAERAASAGLRRVILIDGNRGQGDVGKYLRVSKPLPSIYDAAIADNPRGSIIPPKMLNGARDPRLPQLSFGMVMAPRTGQVDSAVVSSNVYGQVVEEARDVADLVIVDTQITEEEDTSGLWDDVWLPLLRSGGWCVALASDSRPAVQNLRDRLHQWAGDGVAAHRLLIALNDVSAETMLDIDQVQHMLAREADVVGVLPRLDEVKQAFQVGRIPTDVTEVAQVTDAVLLRVTGNPVFAERPAESGRNGFFAGLFGRGRR